MTGIALDDTKLLKKYKNKIRYLSKIAIPSLDGMACQNCGSHEKLERHHPNHVTEPDRVEILCRTCHVAADKALGTKTSRTRAEMLSLLMDSQRKAWLLDASAPIATYLANWRQRMKLTQAEAATLLEVSVRTLRTVEKTGQFGYAKLLRSTCKLLELERLDRERRELERRVEEVG